MDRWTSTGVSGATATGAAPLPPSADAPVGGATPAPAAAHAPGSSSDGGATLAPGRPAARRHCHAPRCAAARCSATLRSAAVSVAAGVDEPAVAGGGGAQTGHSKVLADGDPATAAAAAPRAAADRHVGWKTRGQLQRACTEGVDVCMACAKSTLGKKQPATHRTQLASWPPLPGTQHAEHVL
jgi:hypothetical protein